MQSKVQMLPLMFVKMGLNLVLAKGAKIKVKWFQTFCVTENLAVCHLELHFMQLSEYQKAQLCKVLCSTYSVGPSEG
jgi:hypothetical protein